MILVLGKLLRIFMKLNILREWRKRKLIMIFGVGETSSYF